MLDSTLVEGRLDAYSGSRGARFARTVAMQSRIEHKTTNGPLDRLEGPRLYGNRNQQRSLCSAQARAPRAASTARVTTLALFSAVGPSLLISTKQTAGGNTSDLVSKVDSDPPDACSNREGSDTPPHAERKAYTESIYTCIHKIYIPSLRVEYKCQKQIHIQNDMEK